MTRRCSKFAKTIIVGKPVIQNRPNVFLKMYLPARVSLIARIIWDKVFKNGPSKICGRQPLKNLK